jgi:phage shock protein C
LIKEIWEPNEILSEEKEKKDKSFNFTMPKFEKFYKNSKKWKFLWVCYGLWKSLDIEPIWVRIFFIILFFIIYIYAIILYVLLAIILPEEVKSSKKEINYLWLEWAIKKFFHLLYQFWQKIISILK